MSGALPRPADGCPNCISAERSVIVQPYSVRPDSREGVRAWYRCPHCGHQWACSWAACAMDAEQSGTEPAA